MPRIPDRTELAAIAGLGAGFSLFTFGVLSSIGGGLPTPVGLVIAGGLLGFASAGVLVIYYHVLAITGG